MRNRSSLWFVLSLAAFLQLGACTPAVTTPPAAAMPLEGTQWILSSLRDQDLVPGSSLALGFYPDGYMEGSAGCNSFGVDYSTRGGAFRLAEVHRTHAECGEPPGIMAQDRAFFEALDGVSAYLATEDRLEFLDDGGSVLLAYARKRPPAVDPGLVDTEWLLASLHGSRPLQGTRITLNLGGEAFTGFAGCNNYGGEYEAAAGGAFQVAEIAHTEMDCPSPEGVMEQETAFIQALRSAATYRLSGARLEIAAAGGETILILEGKDRFATQPGDLVGTAWKLVSMDGERPGEAPNYTLAFFSGDVLGGDAGCRDYFATYQATGDDLVLVYEAMFDAGCPVEDADLEQEAAFLGVLAPKADVALGEGRLEIHGERGGILVFEALAEEDALNLEGPTWELQALVGPNPYVEESGAWTMPLGPLAGTAIDLVFEDGSARGSSGCNTYRASYASAASPRAAFALSFDAVALTETACPNPEGVMDQESRYLNLLAAVTGYRIYGDRLWLETEDGRALAFRER